MEQVRNNLYNLKIKLGNNFHTFHTKFIRLAYEAEIAKKKYKFEMNCCLYSKLCTQVI
jgi:hypothetical protein